MKLLALINFSDEILSKLSRTIVKLRSSAVKGSFTPPLNLHVTLVTLGETEDVDAAVKAFSSVDSNKFSFSLGGLGTTKRGSSDVYWIAIRQNSTELKSITDNLVNTFDSAGLPVDKREFNPHLTIGRDIVLTSNFNRAAFIKDIPEMRMEVSGMMLVSVERENDKLVYKPIAEKMFS